MTQLSQIYIFVLCLCVISLYIFLRLLSIVFLPHISYHTAFWSSFTRVLEFQNPLWPLDCECTTFWVRGININVTYPYFLYCLCALFVSNITFLNPYFKHQYFGQRQIISNRLVDIVCTVFSEKTSDYFWGTKHQVDCYNLNWTWAATWDIVIP